MTYRFIVSGFVQGVGFRYFTKREADKLGIKGYAKNLENGSVEVVANVPEKKFEEFYLALKKGSAFSKVREVTYENIEDQEFEDFEIY